MAARHQREHQRPAAGLLPKGTDLGPVTIHDLVRVADEINDRPRKTLDWARPADLLHSAVHGEEDRPGQIGA